MVQSRTTASRRKAPGGVKARSRSRLNKRRAAAEKKTPASVKARRISRVQNAQRKMSG